MKKYSVGIDFGTLSARAVLLDLDNGSEVAERTFKYPHGVIESGFFDGIGLEKTTALQHPKDYLDALTYTVKGVLEDSGAAPESVVGVGIDFTASTVLPVTEDGTPLCFLPKYKNEPHAYVKLWKHHSAEKEADEITALAVKRNEPWLDIYSGKVSSEWMFPKLLEIKHKAPAVYADTVYFMEAGDWIVWQLTGSKTHSSCMAGYKGLWNAETGYPSNGFWALLGMDGIVGTKISENVIPAGSKAGEINEAGASLTSLPIGTAVASPLIDAHAAFPCAGIVDGGKMLMILGTSACHIIMDEKDLDVKGICGKVKDGIAEGYMAYEAGQSGSGDNYDWFVNNCVPESYTSAAKAEGKSIHAYMTEKAAALTIGQSGLISLDWFSGCRTPYADYGLSGMILGLNLNTKPEEIYRAILEGTVFGTKRIIELYEEAGVRIGEIIASGGIAKKNPFLMQTYADVIGKEIKVAKSTQAGAKGSAVLGAVVGKHFSSLKEAAEKLADGCDLTYTPNAENTAKYLKLYTEYKTLCEYFAKENGVMKRIRNI